MKLSKTFNNSSLYVGFALGSAFLFTYSDLISDIIGTSGLFITGCLGGASMVMSARFYHLWQMESQQSRETKKNQLEP